MRGPAGGRTGAAWLLLLGAVSVAAPMLGGCAAVAAYRQCGLSGCAGDTAIRADVRELFRQHPAIEAPNLIDIQVIDRVVYLYGVVSTDLQRQLADSLAHQAQGVTRVVNAIGLDNQGR